MQQRDDKQELHIDALFSSESHFNAIKDSFVLIKSVSIKGTTVKIRVSFLCIETFSSYRRSNSKKILLLNSSIYIKKDEHNGSVL